MANSKKPAPNTERTDVYTVQRLAVYLGLSERYIRDAIRNNGLRAHRKAGRLYVLHSDLVAWITTPISA